MRIVKGHNSLAQNGATMPDTEPDLARQSDSLATLERSAAAAGRALQGALAGGELQGRRLDEVLKSLATRMVSLGENALRRPLQQSLASALSELGSASVAPLSITPFAEGGVVATPTYFPMQGGLGLAGERGAEAILPLARGPDGRLGVASSGGGRPVSVSVTITTPDAESFRRTEAQVSAQLARAVARGQRSL
jgi:hypothetical protein